MNSRQIPTDDLFACAACQLDKIQQPRNVHFTEDGSIVLARQVAERILEVADN